MSIRVTCPGCHSRFNVSDKFAGKEGPCPKCKKKIQIPAKTDEVVIHAPEAAGPKDSKGRAVLKPIARKETKVTPLRLVIVIGLIGLAVGVAAMMRFSIENKFDFPMWILIVGAIAVAPASVIGAYTFLRDQELDAMRGNELWTRVAVCSAIYIGLWGVMLIVPFAANIEPGDSMQVPNGVSMGIMIALGAFAAMLVMEFDYIIGLLHYGMYLAICLLLRWIAGVGALPGTVPRPNSNAETETAFLEIFGMGIDLASSSFSALAIVV